MRFWLPVLVFPAVWAVLFVLWLPVYLVGIPLTGAAAAAGRFRYDPARRCYLWRDGFMSPWETPDNGCLSAWYDLTHKKRGTAFNVWVWSAFRNPVGGNLGLARWFEPGTVLKRGCADPIARVREGRGGWQVAVAGWRVGVWAVRYLGRRSETDHFEFRVGWKLQPFAVQRYRAPFTPWDVGRRIH